MLMRYVHGKQLREVHNLKAGDYFVLELMIQNMGDVQTDQVLDEIEMIAMGSSEMNDSTPSVMIVDTKPPVDTKPSSFYQNLKINGMNGFKSLSPHK